MSGNLVATPIIFDVVSVRPNDSKTEQSSFRFTQNGITSRNNTLMWLIELAYDVPGDDMVSDVPRWAKSTRYDIEARVSASDQAEFARMDNKSRSAMLQGVLEDRFKLRYHLSTKDFPAFALVIAKNGPKLIDARPEDDHSTKVTHRYIMIAKSNSMREIADLLSSQTGKPVLDKTGLTGKYNFTLSWTPLQPPDASPGEASSITSDSAPIIFTAIQEQLGLRLESINTPLKIVVVDHIEEPSAN